MTKTFREQRNKFNRSGKFFPKLIWRSLLFLVSGLALLLAVTSAWPNFPSGQTVFVAGAQRPVVAVIGLNRGLVVFPIRPEAMVGTINGYGRYRADAIFKLGEIEAKNGGKFLAKSLQSDLSIPVDGWFVSGSDCLGSWSCWRKLFFRALLKPSESSFRKKEIVGLAMLSLKTFGKEAEVLSFSETDRIWQKDDAGELTMNKELVGKLLFEKTVDDLVKEEGLTIAAINGTAHQGLASGAARIIENFGGRVLVVNNGEEDKSFCRIIAGRKKSYTLLKMERIFGCETVIGNTDQYRADIVISMGEGYWRELTLPR